MNEQEKMIEALHDEVKANYKQVKTLPLNELHAFILSELDKRISEERIEEEHQRIMRDLERQLTIGDIGTKPTGLV